jgi:phosphoserine phosphatase RsbU/P
MRNPMTRISTGNLTVTPFHTAQPNTAEVLSLVASDLFELVRCEWLVAVVHEQDDVVPVVVLGHPQALAEILAGLRFLVRCLEQDGLEGAVSFPVFVNGNIVGAIALGPSRGLSDEDLRLVSEASIHITHLLSDDRLAARALHRALLAQQTRQQLEAAREVQSRLLPSELPCVPGLDFSGDSRPAGEVGGDFFDFVPLPTGDLGIAVGDVSGKGIPAAIVMAGIQISFRSLARDHARHVAALVRDLNRLVYDVSPPNFYATLFYAEVNPKTGRLTYVNAGHEPPLLIRKSSGKVERLRTGGTVIGLTNRSRYEVGTTFMDPGDLLIAFTDGITEAASEDGSDLRDAGVVDAVLDSEGSRAADIVESVLDSVDRFTGGAKPADDRTVVVLRMKGPAQNWSLAEEAEEELVAVA